MTLVDLIYFYKASWSYLYFDQKKVGFIKDTDITKSLNTYDPYIQTTKEEFKIINHIMGVLGSGNLMDIKHYYDFYSYRNMFHNYLIPNTYNQASIIQTLKIFERMGLVDRERAVEESKEQTEDYVMVCNALLAFDKFHIL